jgi:hypothetical protein
MNIKSCVAGIIGTMAVAGILGMSLVNDISKLEVQVRVPQLEPYVLTSAFKIVDENGVYAVYFNDEIGESNKYRDLIIWINGLHNVHRVKMYLSGNGGSVRGLIDLVNTMQTSPVKFDMIVYGDVYSADAVLALSGSTLTVDKPGTLFLFHAPAEYNEKTKEFVLGNEACSTLKGKKDRGQDAVIKCNNMEKALYKSWDEGMMEPVYAALTSSQIQQIHQGWDVIIPWSELQKQMRRK